MSLAEGLKGAALREALETIARWTVNAEDSVQDDISNLVEDILARPKTSYEQEAELMEAVLMAVRRGGLHSNITEAIEALDKFRGENAKS